MSSLLFPKLLSNFFYKEVKGPSEAGLDSNLTPSLVDCAKDALTFNYSNEL